MRLYGANVWDEWNEINNNVWQQHHQKWMFFHENLGDSSRGPHSIGVKVIFRLPNKFWIFISVWELFCQFCNHWFILGSLKMRALTANNGHHHLSSDHLFGVLWTIRFAEWNKNTVTTRAHWNKNRFIRKSSINISFAHISPATLSCSTRQSDWF